MRIALLHTRYARSGGIETYIARLAEGLLERGHEVHYVSRRPSPAVVLPQGLRHHPIPSLRWPEWLRPLAFALLSQAEVRRVARRSPFDVVHGFSSTFEQDLYTDGSGAASDHAAALAAGARPGLARAWARFAPRRMVASRLEARRFRWSRLHGVLAMSRAARESVLRRHPFPPERIEVLPPPVDLEEFHPRSRERWRAEVRERASAPPGRPVLLFCGNGFARKGLDLLIEALAAPPRTGWTLWVAGRDRRSGWFQSLARSRGVEARFLGFSPDMAPHYAAADAFAFPSRFDAFGAVLLEAMAAGLPAVASARAGASEVIEDGVNGLLVNDPEDVRRLRDRLQALLDPGLRARLGEAARSTAERFDWESHLERVLLAYRAAAGES